LIATSSLSFQRTLCILTRTKTLTAPRALCRCSHEPPGHNALDTSRVELQHSARCNLSKIRRSRFVIIYIFFTKNKKSLWCIMDFVISNVTTVEEEEEPLLEITKIIMLKEKKEYPTKVRKEYSPKVTKEYNTNVRIPKYRKICYVPLCPNTSVSTPDKMFITVPVNPVRRKLWLDAVGKTNGKNPKSPMFCCQDHFNVNFTIVGPSRVLTCFSAVRERYEKL
jgi:hypothetical protein